MRHTGSLAIAAVGLTLLAAPVQAAPAGGLAGDLKTAAGDGTPIEQVRHRHYRRHGPGVNFYFGPRRHYRGHHRQHRQHGHHRRHRR